MKIVKFICFLLLLSTLMYAQSTNLAYADGIIHLEQYGSGTPILIINGGPGMNSQGFRHLAKIIGEKNQAIIYDQRGTGESTISEINSTSITLDKMTEDIEVIRKHLNIEEWVVLGHSFGGMLASYYATKHPKSTKGLILSSSGGINLDLFSQLDIRARLSSTERDSLAYWTSQIANGDTSYHARLKRGTFLAPAYLYDRSNLETVAHRLTQGNWTINGLVFQDMRSSNFDCSAALKTYEKPVLIIQGANDIIAESISEYAHEVLPHSTLVVLEKCGHYGWLDQPEQYFGAIHKYLSRLDS